MNEMTRIVAVPADSYKARFTMEEFLRIVDAATLLDIRLELIDGELQRMSPPTSNHVFRQTSLIAGLLQAVTGSAVRAGVEVGIDLGDNTILTCDAAILNLAEADNRFFQPAELLLAVEVAETSLDRDLGMKRLKYAAGGIPEYWVVDGKRAVVHVFRAPQDGDYSDIDLLRFGQPLPVPGTNRTITLD